MKLSEHLKEVDGSIAEIILLVADRAREIKKAFLTHNFNSNTKNMFGERQLELDKWADKLLIDALRRSKLVRAVASEEQSSIVEIVKSKGELGVVLDPLDGVSSVATNLSVGTIAGIFNEGNVLEKGNKMDAAMYILYGPLTTLVYSAKQGVHEFVLNHDNEFVLRKENITLPEGNIYSPGGLAIDYVDEHRQFISQLESEGYKLRYSGSFTADFQQILTYGGVFSYPSLKEKPDGKLRLLFEANPMSFIIEQAGGRGSDGVQRILDIAPKAIDHRVPLYIGGNKPIELVEHFFRGDVV